MSETTNVTVRYEKGLYIASLPVAGVEDFCEGEGPTLPEAIRDLADNFEALRESL